jgi:hypothetical protein
VKTSVELRSRLAGLHEQLAGTPKVDAESRQLLRTLLTDIERVLDKSEAGASAEPAHRHRLEEVATRFEADHPSLAGVVRQLVDALGRAGL